MEVRGTTAQGYVARVVANVLMSAVTSPGPPNQISYVMPVQFNPDTGVVPDRSTG